ncbi:DinB family protein [Phaeocystidibacter luteus]|uniref:DinB family protein n=1 Tax=Phaeocystidibacter luteus TaxID=911197 RepID=A0A6N6RHZ8_9FLAO|nr:DinB family protein [Phaeocystidibacter luteus]KAB2813955.1 DinB family protein [Phaeocystidibacter luteus]
MKGNAELLITDLISRTEAIISQAEEWRQLGIDKLNKKPSPESWSALECLEHLNRYGDFYLPEIENQISHAEKGKPKSTFVSSWLGEYFAQSMLPKEKLNKMNTFKNMNPSLSGVRADVLEDFIQQQKRMIRLLERSRDINIQKTKTAISISKWIRLRLGDTYRVVIYHNERHMVQGSKALRA